MKWYKHDPSAALAGMFGLTIEERGAYYTLIDVFYDRDGHVPDDDWLLSRIMQCNPRTWRRLKLALFQKKKVSVNSAGELVPNRGERTLNEARTFSELQSNRASTRWEREKITNKNNDAPMPSAVLPSTTTTTTTKKESPSDSCAVAVATRPEMFEEFWKAYPKRDGANPKEPARKAFLASIKSGIDPAQIIAGARACAAKDRDKIGTPYIPQAVKWLRDRRWQDYGASTGPPPSTGFDPSETSAQRIARYQAEHFGNGTSSEAARSGQGSGLGETGSGDDPEFRFESRVDDARGEQGPVRRAILAAAGKMRIR